MPDQMRWKAVATFKIHGETTAHTLLFDEFEELGADMEVWDDWNNLEDIVITYTFKGSKG